MKTRPLPEQLESIVIVLIGGKIINIDHGGGFEEFVIEKIKFTFFLTHVPRIENEERKQLSLQSSVSLEIFS